ncbi:MAG: ATP-dependent helicase, partial [Desulfovermiculus sp.]|nr:ATP-dependent helicase [Desulfovermiculus sp.]
VLMSEQDARQIFALANPELSARELNTAWDRLARVRESGHIPPEFQSCLQAFSEYKAAHNLTDYTDLLHSWLQELGSGEGQPFFSQVLVDEIQDLTQLQGEIIKALVPKEGNGFFGIGDPNQSIYGFRGAMGNVALQFGQQWPSLEIVALYRNYRSRQEILDLSSKLCPESPALQAQTFEPRANLTWYQAESGAQEAYWIAEQVKELIGGTSHLQADSSEARHLAPPDIAVLVRIKALIPPLQKALDQHGLPCSVPESSPFWHDERIRLILRSIARCLGVPFDQGREILDKPELMIHYSPNELARTWARDERFHHTFWTSQPFQDLCAAYDSHQGWTELLAYIHLEEDAAHIRHQAQSVRLLTLHAAKGLEFEVVFLPALEQGIIPFAGPELFAGKNQAVAEAIFDMEEEKRLLYVGLTRPHSHLYMSCAKRRTLGRMPLHLPPSPFLQDVDFSRVCKVRRVARTRQKVKQLSLWDGLK